MQAHALPLAALSGPGLSQMPLGTLTPADVVQQRRQPQSRGLVGPKPRAAAAASATRATPVECARVKGDLMST